MARDTPPYIWGRELRRVWNRAPTHTPEVAINCRNALEARESVGETTNKNAGQIVLGEDRNDSEVGVEGEKGCKYWVSAVQHPTALLIDGTSEGGASDPGYGPVFKRKDNPSLCRVNRSHRIGDRFIKGTIDDATGRVILIMGGEKNLRLVLAKRGQAMGKDMDCERYGGGERGQYRPSICSEIKRRTEIRMPRRQMEGSGGRHHRLGT